MNKKKNIPIQPAGSFTIEERKRIVEDYLSSNDSKSSIWFKYTGQKQEHGYINRWMRQLGLVPNSKPDYRFDKRFNILHQQQIIPVGKEKKELSQEELVNRVKYLEKQLEASQLRVEGYEIMIEIAEKELRFPIRKKSGTK